MPDVERKIKILRLDNKKQDDFKEERVPSLLQTIKMPKELKRLQRRLPKS